MHKDRDVDLDDRPREKRRSSKTERKSKSDKEKDRDRDRDGDRDRDRDREREHRHRSSRVSRRPSESDTHSHSHSTRRKNTRDDPGNDRSSSLTDLVPEMFRNSMQSSTERVSLPYPTFSKVHSKEAVYSKEDLSTAPRRTDPLTPEATDLGTGSEKQRSKSADFAAGRKVSSSKDARPPSPPETDLSTPKRKSPTLKASRADREDKERPSSRASGSDSRPSSRTDKSRVSTKSKSSLSQATYIKSPGFPPSQADQLRKSSSKRSISAQNSKRPEPLPVDVDSSHSSPESAQDSSPQTPTQTPQFPPPQMFPEVVKPETPAHIHFQADDSQVTSETPGPANFGPPPPPPPPPPPLNIREAPRIDYLLQNGGLGAPLSTKFLSVLPRQNGTRPSNPPLAGAQTLFAPFFNLLDQYNAVLNNQGSIAVATGHRSVARRLLDRLENVFSRDLPATGCVCIMCERSHDIHKGLGWGDVLEWVSGRKELPQWPPFDLAALGLKAAEISAELPPRPSSPVKLDPDIAEEFREHYLRQSKKVRAAVDRWLSHCAEAPAPPPQDVDDETLTFAIMTNLDQEDRPFFMALLTGARELQPTLRAPTPMRKPRTDFMVRTGLALQRLHRLQQVPRDAETATYLIKNPQTHDLLVAISDINNSEWEILTSGRFDGFLWSGAEGEDSNTPFAVGGESRGPTPANGYFGIPRGVTASPGFRGATPGMGPTSRNTTPFSPYSRGATPASFVSAASSSHPGGAAAGRQQAVSNDEEMEMAALAEVEREIYQGMEALEDAFEALHQRAEVVRTALRDRGAALMHSLQSRRRIDVLPNPSSGNSQKSGYERPAWAAAASEGEAEALNSDSEWGRDDDFELMPDDSASNISSSRHRRPKRRTERRTPAPIEEDEEEN